ncbi:MAG: DoxX family protein [Candidatus Giovannonibacteria bacterium]|nr:DoxX family protein [Candidatus Giovannonibacteria bacterium]
MLSVLPQFLDYSFYAPTILRLALGAVFLIHGYPKLFEARLRLAGLLEFIAGVLLAIGLFTQAAALVLAVELLIIIIWFKRGQKFVGGWEFDFVLLIMALALLVLGSGAWAFDLPL